MKIRCVLVPVGKKPYVKIIDNDLSTMQSIVDGFIEIIHLNNMLLVCNEEGKINGMPGNRRVNGDIIAGDFFVIGNGEDGDSRDLTDDEIENVFNRFGDIESYTPEEVENCIRIEFFSL